MDLYIGYEPVEYFCYGCGQLRLSVREFDGFCTNCGSSQVVVGEPNSLDKDTLKKEYKDGKRTK